MKQNLLYSVFYHGDLPRVNRKYVPAYSKKRRKSFMRLSDEWNQKFGAMILSFKASKKPGPPIECLVDVVIILNIRSVTDSDASIKGIFDALEKSGVVKNDKQIRPFVVKTTEVFMKDTGEYVAVGVFKHSPMFPYSQEVMEYMYNPLEAAED